MSCPTEGFCVAVDLLGRYLTFNGTSWSAPQPIATGFGVPTSVSCASENFCATVDGGVGIEVGNVITYGGAIAGWGDANTLDAGAQSISCPSATFCGVDDQSGDTLTYDPAEAIDDVTNPLVSHLDPGSLESVSCPSQSFCATVDNNGLASTYNGSGWSSLAQIDPNAFASVSCASQNFCVAVDKQGGAVLYELTPNNTAPPAIAGTAQQGDTLTLHRHVVKQPKLVHLPVAGLHRRQLRPDRGRDRQQLRADHQRRRPHDRGRGDRHQRRWQ